MLNDPWNMHSKTALFGESLYDKFRDAFNDFTDALARDLGAKLGGGWSGSGIGGPANAISSAIDLKKMPGEKLSLYLHLDGQLHVQATVVYHGLGVAFGSGQKFKTSWDSFRSRVADGLADEIKKNFGI